MFAISKGSEDLVSWVITHRRVGANHSHKPFQPSPEPIHHKIVVPELLGALS
jgi:hypothetical protein